MPKVILIGDLGTEHDGYHTSPVIEGSSSVYIDGRQVARVGDALVPHEKPNHPTHPRTIITGASSVFIDGKAVAVEGSKIDCGGVLIASNRTVNID